jgi:cytochrome c-type biogenesis protein CcmH/NrfG
MSAMRHYPALHRFPQLLGCLTLLAAAGLIGCAATPNTVLRQNAAEAIEEHRTDDAAGFLARAVQQNPTDWQAQYMLGKIRLEQGRFVDAELALNNAYELNKDWPEAPVILDAEAEAIYRQGHRAELASFLQRCARDRQTMHDFLRQARYLTKIGDMDGAALALKMATKLANKTDPKPYLERAEYYQSIKDNDNALLDLRRAYTIDPSNDQVKKALLEMGVVPGPTLRLPPAED